MWGTVLISDTNPCRTTAWSSTTTMLMLSLLTRLLPFQTRLLCATNSKAQLRFNRHADQHLAPLARAAVDADAAAHLLGALAHADEAEVAVRAVRLTLLVEPAPFVFDAQAHAAGVQVETDDYRPPL